MKELFFNGGPVFMTILSLILFIVVIISVSLFIRIINKKMINHESLVKITFIKSLGLLAMILGLLGQLIGLFSAFRAINLGQVQATRSLFSEGFIISMIPSVYGILTFGLSLLIGYVFKSVLKN